MWLSRVSWGSAGRQECASSRALEQWDQQEAGKDLGHCSHEKHKAPSPVRACAELSPSQAGCRTSSECTTSDDLLRGDRAKSALPSLLGGLSSKKNPVMHFPHSCYSWFMWNNLSAPHLATRIVQPGIWSWRVGVSIPGLPIEIELAHDIPSELLTHVTLSPKHHFLGKAA